MLTLVASAEVRTVRHLVVTELCAGCQFCQKVWLGMHDGRPPGGHDTRDETRMRDVMAQRYEKKRWYVQPTDAMYEEARRLNTPSPQAAAARQSAITRPQTAAFDLQVTSLLIAYSLL